jgi:membrane associated rhomboid family serine protease
MPICPRCGKEFSGFSFGSSIATECRDCRKSNPESIASAAATPADATGLPSTRFTPVVTLTLIGLNVFVYLAMGLSGASWTEPSIEHALRWGADFGPFTIGGQWWRILTSTFVHFGIIHIGLNMWCLWDLGTALERFMGRRGFGVTYLLSGLLASLTSIWWNPWRVSAGASGAIFGVAGAFVSYLFFKKAPLERAQVKRQLKSLLVFIGYNLLYGARAGVDNSAHVGGLIAGLIVGALLPPALKRIHAEPEIIGASATAAPNLPGQNVALSADEKIQFGRPTLQIALGGLIVLLGGALWIRSKAPAVAHYGAGVAFIRSGQYDQGFAEMQAAAAADSSLYFPKAYLGVLELERGNPAAAVPVLERTKAIVPFYGVSHNLALAYLGTGRPTEALTEITSAIQFEGNQGWRAQYILAVAAQQSGNAKLADDTLRAIVQRRPALQTTGEGAAELDLPMQITSTTVVPYSKLAFKSKNWPLYP